jgi:hypothetical protein
MTAKHTPGPWTVELRGMRGAFHIPEAQRHEAEVADHDGVDGYTVSKANANLIAAAPTMRQLLQDALDEIHHPGANPGITERIMEVLDANP